MRCCQCQKALPDGALFCKYCGARQTPQETEVARKEVPQAETIPSSVHQPTASPAVEREMPRAAAAGETEEPPALFTEETGECPPELCFRDVPEEMEQPAQPEPEGLIFDLDQILQEITPNAAEPKSGETASSTENAAPLWFDPDEVSKPADVAENAGPEPEAVPLESNQDVTPELREAEAAPAEPEVKADGAPAEPPIREIPAAEQVALSDEEPPASNPETELHATEQKEDVAPLAKQTCIHAEQRASLPVEEYRPEQHEKSTAPAGTKPQGVSDEPVAEVSKKREKKSVLPILWRLAVIAVELGVIAYLSIHLFF